MNLNFSYRHDKKEWEKAVLSFSQANFLQSFNWGEFQESIDKKVLRLLAKEDEEVVAVAQMVLEPAKRGSYLAIAGGPVFRRYQDEEKNRELITKVFNEIKRIAKLEKVVFIRFRLQDTQTPLLLKTLKTLGACKAQMHLTADLTLQLNLEKTEDELLKQMRKNTRYSIRQVAKKEVVVKFSKDPKEIKEFYQHQANLAKKHHFVPFSYKFLYQQFLAFVKEDQVLLIHAYKDEKLLASAFVIFYNKEAVYHYGISTVDNARLPGSYACQWSAIKEAKKRGMKYYNFWGIAPEENKEHRFAGVSLFKRGFGGQEVEYLPAFDIPLTPKYYLTKSFEFIRKKTRKLG